MIEMQKRHRGRPDIFTQYDIEEKIAEYFSRGIPALITSQDTGYNIKTVRKHYEKLAHQKISQNQSGFMLQCKINIASTASAIGQLILDLLKRKYEFEIRFEELKSEQRYDACTEREYRGIAKTLAHMYVVKLTVENSPTADIVLTKMVKDLVNKNVIPQLSN